MRAGIAHGARTVLAFHAVQLPDVGATVAYGTITHWWLVNEAFHVRAER